MLIQSIKLTNVLSFGPDAQELELKPLNVLIGPNGSGKSNLIEVIGLLQAAPKDLLTPIREGGGVGNWIWQGESGSNLAEIEVLVSYQNNRLLRYMLVFRKDDQRFQVNSEQLDPVPSDDAFYPYFDTDGKMAHLYDQSLRKETGATTMKPVRISTDQSIFAQVKGPMFPELTHTGEQFQRMGLFREWSFGRHTPPRLPQEADLPNNFLMESGQNLGLVLNWLKREPKAADRLLSALRRLYASIVDFDVHIEGGTVQVFLREGDITVPATRLSDGTLRYLCLLAILCHPTPPPLVCIEEPELGLHPDILPGLAELLREASERCQLIVTTHSDVIVDALTDTPESVVVCEKQTGRTTLKRLDKDALAHWLERYRLGDLWTSGELGGNRW
ncbi:MAG: AAA family ATPase [Nitrospira sp.]|nr:AAA family ATPase [Nitrospira sp.]